MSRLYDMLKAYTIEEIGNYYADHHYDDWGYSTWINDHLIVYNEYINQRYIRNYELKVVLTILAFNFHFFDELESIKSRYRVRERDYKTYKSLVTPLLKIGKARLNDNQNINSDNLGIKKIVIVNCSSTKEANLPRYLYSMTNTINESGIREVTSESVQKFNMKHYHKVQVINSNNFKDYKKLIDAIPEADIVILYGHSINEGSLLIQNYFDGSYSGKPVPVNTIDFIVELNHKIKDKVLLNFTCDGNDVFNNSEAKHTIGQRKDVYLYAIEPYLFTLMSTLFYEEDFRKAHDLAKLIGRFFNKEASAFEISSKEE